MTAQCLYWPILLPSIVGGLMLLFRRGTGAWAGVATVIVTLVNLITVIALFGKELLFTVPWGGFGFEFSLRLYHLSSFITLGVASFAFLVALYSMTFMRGRWQATQFFGYFLLTIGFANGAVLSNSLLGMLFFWEGLLLMLFGMIAVGHPGAFKSAVKAFVINGATDLVMILGVGLTIYLAGTMDMTRIKVPLDAVGSLAFVLLMIGAIAKAGSVPFHSWMPDAATDSPLPFMALVPAAIEKLLGIYFLARISLDFFPLDRTHWLSTMMMVVGSITILVAVLMALVQKDYKRTLAYSSISQVGYIVLGIGTCVPAGIIGGLFHMINHALYKSCLFLAGGAVERQAGTTELSKLGGLGRRMPLTFMGFLIAAASICGIPPFNGFFSKELLYEGALERGTGFYLVAVIGSLLTAAYFLKLGHSVFLGKDSEKTAQVKEAPIGMLIPILALALICVFFGVANVVPIQHLIQPILGEARLEGHVFGGFHVSGLLVAVTLSALVLVFVNHWFGAKKNGSGVKALDHIVGAPVVRTLYSEAEKGTFDPYDIAIGSVNLFARLAWWIDRSIDFIYNTVAVETAKFFSAAVRKAHTGSYVMYLLWALAGLLFVILITLGGF